MRRRRGGRGSSEEAATGTAARACGGHGPCRPRTTPLAPASLVLSGIALFYLQLKMRGILAGSAIEWAVVCGIGPAGLILAIVSLVLIRRHPGKVGGATYARLGLILWALIYVPMLGLFSLRYAAKLEKREVVLDGLCESNVSELLSYTMATYVAEHGGMLPAARTWSDEIGPYLAPEVKSREVVFVCPKARGKGLGYAFNASLGGVRASAISDPSHTVVIYESDAVWNANAAGGPELLPLQPRHHGGDNYGFADGHVQWIKRKKLPDGSWAKEPDADWVIWKPVLKKGEGDRR